MALGKHKALKMYTNSRIYTLSSFGYHNLSRSDLTSAFWVILRAQFAGLATAFVRPVWKYFAKLLVVKIGAL